MYDGLKISLKFTSTLEKSLFMEILFATRRQRLCLGEVGHMGGHMGVVLNKNVRACNHLPPPPIDRWWSRGVYRYFGPINLCHFVHVIHAGRGIS